jgi:hypothetical protein
MASYFILLVDDVGLIMLMVMHKSSPAWKVPIRYIERATNTQTWIDQLIYRLLITLLCFPFYSSASIRNLRLALFCFSYP